MQEIGLMFILEIKVVVLVVTVVMEDEGREG